MKKTGDSFMKAETSVLFDFDPLIRRYIHQAGIVTYMDTERHTQIKRRLCQARSQMKLLTLAPEEDESEKK